MITTKKSDASKRRAANSILYAAKPTVAARNTAVQDPRLRRILVETMDALKRPDAVPSTVIYAALEKAAEAKKSH